MGLLYKFKKEQLEDGRFVSRPRIPVILHGETSIEVVALIDSGCDITVIPEDLAKAVGLNLKGTESTLYGFRESNKVIQSKASLTFMGKEKRQNIKVQIPILIVESKEGFSEDAGIVLGVEGVFDKFNINFKKAKNQIILSPV